jgi:hypothetical protein
MDEPQFEIAQASFLIFRAMIPMLCLESFHFVGQDMFGAGVGRGSDASGVR